MRVVTTCRRCCSFFVRWTIRGIRVWPMDLESKASLALEGRMVPSHESFQLPVEVAGLGVVGLLLQPIHFHAKSGFRDRGLVLLRQVELALLLKTRARGALAEGLVLGPFLGELLGETALRRNGPGRSGLMVLRAGRRRGGNLTVSRPSLGQS